jgi:hypothetical protein
MAITGAWKGEIFSPGGSGSTSATVYLHFPTPLNVTAQVAIFAFGATGSISTGIASITGFAQNFGAMQAGGDATFFENQVTDIWVTATCNDAWVFASVIIYQWD